MIAKIAEYEIKEKELDTAIEIIRRFVIEVEKNEPLTYYRAFRKPETNQFIHFMRFRDTKAEEKHGASSYTAEFTKELYPKCVNEPVFTDVDQITG